MGILSRLVERRSAGFRVSDDLPDGHWLVRWLGGRSEAGVVVNETTALNSLLVVSCVRILAETLATLPLPVYRRLAPRGRERARNHSLYRILHDEPNPYMTSVTYFERVMAHLALWGNHYSRIEWSGSDVAALWPLHPRRVEPYLTEDGELRYRLDGRADQSYPASDIMHVPGLGMDGVTGLSPLAMMRQAIGLAVAAESYGARFFANDARPSIVLKHPLTLSETARKNLVESFTERNAGRRRGGVDVLEEGMDLVEVGMPPQDAQFLETRRFQVQELARFFRIPPHLLADVERSTSWGSGIEQQNIGFVVYTMRPWLVRIEKEINRKLLPPGERERYYAEFLVDGLLRGDLNARKEYYATARQWGWMSANDILELENQNPIPNGDVYLQPLNMIEAGTQPEQSPEPDAGPERSAGNPEYRSAREARSVTSRRRLANAHVTIYRDAIGRLIRIEKQDVGAAIRRHLRERSAAAFESWVREYYYERFPQRVIDHMLPPVTTLMTAIAAEVVEELGADEVPVDTVERFAHEYVETFALRHCGASRSRLLAILRDASEGRAARQAEELAEVLEEELSTWDERVGTEAEDEAHRGSNAIAWAVYGALGVLTLRWIATGSEPCDYCSALDGRTVGTGDPFLLAGQALAPGGLNPFVSQSTIRHPPLHTGCQCVIAPG